MASSQGTRAGFTTGESIRDVVGRWPRSGETQARYCARHGISLSAFAYWRRRLAKEGAVVSAPVTFHELSLTGSPDGASASRVVGARDLRFGSDPASGGWVAEIAMPNGVVIRVAAELDPTSLTAIIDTVIRAC